MSRPLVKWLILIALLAYVAVMASVAGSAVRDRLCSGIDIVIQSDDPSAAAFLTPEAVKRELGTLPSRYARTRLSAIDTDSLERHLNAVNNFESIEVIRTSSGKLRLNVVPMIPEVRVFTSAETYYINKDGKRLDAHSEYFADLPIVRGNFTHKMPASGVLPVTRYIARDSLLRNLITMVEYKSPTNIILVPRIRGHVINLGDTSRLKEKFDNLTLLYRKVMPYKGWNTYDTISLKYKGQIVATRADKNIARHTLGEDAEGVDPEEASLDAQTMTIPDEQWTSTAGSVNKSAPAAEPEKSTTEKSTE